MRLKSKTNLLIDMVLMLLLAAMAGFGFLIKYILVPGFQRNKLYGSDVELYFMGLDRHQWGTVHLWVSLVFVFFILIHIILHWKMIVCLFTQMFSGKLIRKILVVVFLFFVLMFSVGPLFVKPDIVKAEKHYLNQHKGRHEMLKNKNLNR